MNSFRSWVRKYMKNLEEKDKLSLKELFLSGLFRLIARTIKVFVSFVSIILTAFDFKRRKILSEFDKFFLNLGKEDLVIIYVDKKENEKIPSILSQFENPKNVLFIFKDEQHNKQIYAEDRLIEISNDLFFKYYSELKTFLMKSKGFFITLTPDIKGAELLVDLNALKYTTISFLSENESNLAKFIMKNSLRNNSIKEEI